MKLHVNRHLVALTANAVKLTNKQYALVYQTILAIHLVVDPNVLLVQNVHKTRLVLNRNVQIHVQEFAD